MLCFWGLLPWSIGQDEAGSRLEERALPNLCALLNTCSGLCLGALKVPGIVLLISVPQLHHLQYLIDIFTSNASKMALLASIFSRSFRDVTNLPCLPVTDSVKLSSLQWAIYLSSQNPPKLDITEWRNPFTFMGK